MAPSLPTYRSRADIQQVFIVSKVRRRRAFRRTGRRRRLETSSRVSRRTQPRRTFSPPTELLPRVRIGKTSKSISRRYPYTIPQFPNRQNLHKISKMWDHNHLSQHSNTCPNTPLSKYDLKTHPDCAHGRWKHQPGEKILPMFWAAAGIFC